MSILAKSKRQDDWRCHYQLNLTDIATEPKENAPILDLLLRSPKILARLRDMMPQIGGIFYSQIAFRTPVPASLKTTSAPDYQIGAEYHLDGQANASGERFPDHWTVLLGIALVDINTENMGNFTVFPGSHIARDWSSYPEEKRSKTLPSFKEHHKICMNRGDAVFCHVLLPHRGGKNTLEFTDREADSVVKNIQTQTREMVFFRIKAKDICYHDKARSLQVLQDPWNEHFQIFEKFPDLTELKNTLRNHRAHIT